MQSTKRVGDPVSDNDWSEEYRKLAGPKCLDCGMRQKYHAILLSVFHRCPSGSGRYPAEDLTPWSETLNAVREALADFYDPGDIERWLESPHVDLNGWRPVDVIAEGGADAVLDIIDRLQSGAYL